MASVFELGGVSVEVEADPDDRRWLAGFGGCDERTEAPPAVFRVAFEAGSGALPSFGSRGEHRVVFALDSGPLRLPVALTASGALALDEAAGAFIEVTGAGRSARIRYTRDRLAARLLLLRVVREYAHNQALEDGALVLHAAAVEEHGEVHAIAGAKGAGKTTLALRRMAEGARYLSNDRVRVDPDGRVCGIPTVVTLRPGTWTLFPGLESTLRRSADYRRHAAETACEGPREDAAGLRVSPAQLCAAFGQTPAPSGVLSSILFLDPEGGSPRPLDPEVAAAALEASLVGSAAGVPASELFRPAGPSRVTAASLRERCRVLARRVACVSGRP